MKICVVGTGYVGLVSGTCLAERGHEVVCIDIDQAKVDLINSGVSPIHEDGLDELLVRNTGKRLRASTQLSEGMQDADVALICVGTPFDGRHIDLRYVLQVAEEIGAQLRTSDGYCVVAVKSTVVPGTTAGSVRQALESASGKRAGMDFGLGMNPEFLAEGAAVKDFMHPDRIVVGGVDERSTEQLARMYASFEGVPVQRTNPSTAEMIKYASNAFMATVISYSNEIADYCEATEGVDATEVMRGLHEMKQLNVVDDLGVRHKSSACALLWAGCGFGGSCFPKDVKALVAAADSQGVDTDILTSVLRVNGRRPDRMIAMLSRHFPDVDGLAVTVLGLAFKPGTDDVRESPALAIVEKLVGLGANVTCHDPVALETGRTALIEKGVDPSNVVFEGELEQALRGAAAVLLVTSWEQYRSLPEAISRCCEAPVVIDGRRLLNHDDFGRYEGIGRGKG